MVLTEREATGFSVDVNVSIRSECTARHQVGAPPAAASLGCGCPHLQIQWVPGFVTFAKGPKLTQT